MLNSRARFERGDLQKRLPFANSAFDLIFSVFVLNELRVVDRVFREFKRVLRPSGKVVLVLTHPAFVLYHQLFEKFTGNKSHKLLGKKSYFAKQRLRYVFTLAGVGTGFYQHTFEELVAAAANNRLRVTDLRELRTNAHQFRNVPAYWDTRDIPKYLIVTLS